MLSILPALLLACSAPGPDPVQGEVAPRAGSPDGPLGAELGGSERRRADDPVRPPRTIGETLDGTIRDVAGTPAGPWITSSRNLRRLDPLTGEPAELHPSSPYPTALTALEAPADGRLIVASQAHLFVHEPEGVTRALDLEGIGQANDVKPLGETGLVAFLAGLEVLVAGPRGESGLEVVGRTGPTEDLLSVDRLTLFEHEGVWTAYVVGTPRRAQRRGMRSLLVADLGADGRRPRFYDESFEPAEHFRNVMASAIAVRVVASGGRRIAYVACGIAGQLVKVDVTDPSKPRFLEQIVVHEGQPVANLAVDHERNLLFVASANWLHVMDLKTERMIGKTHVAFYDGGARDMALCVLPDGRRTLWTGVQHSVEFVINGLDVTDPEKPRPIASRWWIGSSDGAVAVPEWSSVYLPTWGGIARYDISDMARPEQRGYQPARVGATEHIELCWPDPEDRERAFLLTAQGNGPVLIWPISREAPDPGVPRRFDFMPPEMRGNEIYQNDVAAYQRDGELYVLSDIADRTAHRVALRALQVSTGKWLHVTENNPRLRANAQAVGVHGDLAFVTVAGGFFVVRLDRLPERLEIVGEHVIELGDRGPTRTSGLVLSPDMRTLFLATDTPGRVASYAYDPRTYRLSKPLHVLTGVTAVVGRLRLHERTQRLYAAGREGILLEIDASNPRRLALLSTWKSEGYNGAMQDIFIMETAEGPRLLVSKNTQGFAILDPDDGL